MTNGADLLLHSLMNNPPQQAESRAGTLALVGGVLALDFCNTSSGRGTDRHVEHLQDASNLLTWARHAAILDEPAERHLRLLCDADQGLARRLLGRALALREAIYTVDVALAQGKEADQSGA